MILYAEEAKLAHGVATHHTETQVPVPLHTELLSVPRARFGAYAGSQLTSVVVNVCCCPGIKY